MSKVLYVMATPKNHEESYTLTLSNKFVEEYKKLNPEDIIVNLDLYKEKVPHLSKEAVEDYGRYEGVIMEKSKEFSYYDKYIFAFPMWNLSVPSILKAYIDHIIASGITFEYRDGIPVGLLSGKKALVVVTRGGYYSAPPSDEYAFDTTFMKGILKFMGIEDYAELLAEGAGRNNQSPKELLEENIENIYNLLKDF